MHQEYIMIFIMHVSNAYDDNDYDDSNHEYHVM